MLRNIIFQLFIHHCDGVFSLRKMGKMFLRVRSLFVMLLVTCVASFAMAGMKSFTVDTSTASRVDTTSNTSTDGSTTTTTNTYTVFGGYAGDVGGCSSQSSTSVCNSCSVLTNSCGTYYSCATRSVNPALILKMSFVVDQIPAGATVKARWNNSTSGTDVTLNNSPTATANVSIPVEIKWGQICERAGLSATDCDLSTLSAGTPAASFTDTMYVGLVDSNNSFISGSMQSVTVRFHVIKPDASSTMTTSCGSDQAFCAFKVIPGDGKVFVKDVSRGTSGPGSAGIKWEAMRVFYKEISTKPTASSDFCSISLGSNYKDLSVTDKSNIETKLEPNKVTDLTNDKLYMFTVASIDETTVVTGLMDTSDLFASVDDHVAMPGEVIGLLDDKHCFVATAAYGSDMAPQVNLLRKFRNQFLIPNTLGRKFVKLYYQFSPPLAQYISEHPTLRIATRGVLWPMIWLADVAVQWPQAFVGFFFALLLLSLGLFLKKAKLLTLRRSHLFFLVLTMGLLAISFSVQAASASGVASKGGTLVDEENRQQEEYIRLKQLNEEEVSSDPNQNRYPSERAQENQFENSKSSTENNDSIKMKPDAQSKNRSLVDEETKQQDEYIKLKKQDEVEVSSDQTQNRYPPKNPRFEKPAAPEEGNTLRVEHPDAEKGLLKIEPDGSYRYKTDEKAKTQAVSVRVANMSTPTVTNSTGTATFDSMYGSNDLVGGLIDYQWMPFRQFGSLGLNIETGFFSTTGKGFFKSKRTDGTNRAEESYSLYIIPASIFLNYRFEYWNGQLFVPFVYGGGTYYGLVESRDDGKTPKTAGTSAFGGGGGLLISLSRLDTIAKFTMSSEYGVTDMWLVIEGRAMQGVYEDLDFTNHFINVGVVIDF